MSSTLRQARKLQKRYTRLGAATTQNVRNPIPMHTLALSTLPLLPDPNATVPVVIETRFTFNGKLFIDRSKGFKYVRDIVPHDEWQQGGKTAQDVMNDLTKAGYIVRSKAVVAFALSIARACGKIAAVKQLGSIARRGKPAALYFATK